MTCRNSIETQGKSDVVKCFFVFRVDIYQYLVDLWQSFKHCGVVAYMISWFDDTPDALCLVDFTHGIAVIQNRQISLQSSHRTERNLTCTVSAPSRWDTSWVLLKTMLSFFVFCDNIGPPLGYCIISHYIRGYPHWEKHQAVSLTIFHADIVGFL
jgi:hypothetical protein